MKALVYHGTKDLRYEDFADPHVNTGEVLLRIKASGLCHTDFNEYINGPLHASSKKLHLVSTASAGTATPTSCLRALIRFELLLGRSPTSRDLDESLTYGSLG
jgi:hypothetical protein